MVMQVYVFLIMVLQGVMVLKFMVLKVPSYGTERCTGTARYGTAVVLKLAVPYLA